MNAPTLTFDSFGRMVTVTPELGRYGNERLAISLIESNGELWGTLTVNMVNDHLNSGEVFIKDWSENEPAVAAALEAGWFVPTGREVVSGYVAPKVMKPAGQLAEWIAAQS
jgi:hypothetical protein